MRWWGDIVHSLRASTCRPFCQRCGRNVCLKRGRASGLSPKTCERPDANVLAREEVFATIPFFCKKAPTLSFLVIYFLLDTCKVSYSLFIYIFVHLKHPCPCRFSLATDRISDRSRHRFSPSTGREEAIGGQGGGIPPPNVQQSDPPRPTTIYKCSPLQLDGRWRPAKNGYFIRR